MLLLSSDVAVAIVSLAFQLFSYLGTCVRAQNVTLI